MKMVFHAQSWGWLRVEGQLRGCGHSPSFWCKVPGEHGPKLPWSVPTAGRSKFFQEFGAVLGKLRERGKLLTPSSLSSLPTHLWGLRWGHWGQAGTLPSRVAHLHATSGLAWDHGPHLPKVSRLPSNARRHKLLLYVISFFYAIS